MRALLAGLFVFGSMLAMVSWIGSRHPNDREWPGWAAPVLIGTFLGSAIISMFLFNKRGSRPLGPGQTHEERMEELKAAGLLVETSFRAKRAFEVEEFEDEGRHYYIELENGDTLYLNGQYLYDFEPIDDDPELNQPRRFPCTEFTLLRHKKNGYVVDIACSGQVLKPEVLAPPFDQKDFKLGLPEDGEVISGTCYDSIKATRLKGGTGETVHA